jgi:TonB family protein
MKTLLAAGVGALLLAATTATTATAATTPVQQFASRAEAQAQAKLSAAGVNLNGQTVAVRAVVDGDGRLNAVHVVRSSGSHDTDAAVETALRKLTVADAPPALVGGAITLNLGSAPTDQAAAR